VSGAARTRNTARWNSARSRSASLRRRTGCTKLVSRTTAASAPGETRTEVPVKPVCQKVPCGHRPQPEGLRRQPRARTSPLVASCIAVMIRMVSAFRTGWCLGRSKAPANRARSSAVPNRPAWPLTPPSANAFPSWTSPLRLAKLSAGRPPSAPPRPFRLGSLECALERLPAGRQVMLS